MLRVFYHGVTGSFTGKREKNSPIFRGIPWFFLFFLCLFNYIPIHAKVRFSVPDLSADNRVLFRAVSSSGGAPDQSVLYLARLPGPGEVIPPDSGFRQLSAFPEYLDLIENGRTLQIRNAFGAVRIPASGGLPRPIPGLSSFVDGNPAMGGRTGNMAVSADGRWILYLETVSAAYGKLILVDTASGRKTEISSRVEKPERLFPASWSPNSRYFVYGKGGRLYYYGINSTPVDERFRLVGEGSANSVYWGQEGFFYYFRGSSLYQVRESDLFTRSLYVDFLELGKPAGNIPFEFNPAGDRFWMAPDALSILVSRGGNNIFYFPLDGGDSERTRGASLPYLGISQSFSDIQVLWPSDGTITVLVAAGSPGMENAGGKNSALLAWRLNTAGNDNFFNKLPDEGQGLYRGANISPDGRRVLFWGEPGAALFDYESWKPLVTLSERKGYSGLWNGNNEVIIGDDLKIEKIRLAVTGGASSRGVITGRDLLCLSQAELFGFENRNVPAQSAGEPALVLARSGETFFATDGSNPWVEILNAALRNASQTSAFYRVYLEEQSAGLYENLLMVRNTSSVGTFSLIPGIGPQLTGRKELALCFDLYDDDAGLSEVLNALDLFGLRATFFLGGEFIRRYPETAKDIAVRGHETASLFFAPINLSDTRYRVTREFISQGLARNEDEFNRAAGRELSLIWHPPYYASSQEINSAAASAGYLTVNRDFDPMDWVNQEDEIRLGLPFYSSADLIDRIMDGAKNGALIPIRLGLQTGGRKEYLYSRINVLLDAMTKEAYTIVTVSQLLKN